MTSTYFATEDGNIYAVSNGGEPRRWPDDVPYLLCMDNKGTGDKTDDEVLVVWRTD